MNNADYWTHRLKIAEEAILNDAYKSVQEVERVCEVAIADCDTLIRAWYQRLAANNNVSYIGARKLLAADELEEFKWTVREYIKKGEENAISGEWAKQLENASARHHISKYEALKLQLQHRAELISQARATATANAAKHAYTDSYYHTAFEMQRGFGAGYSFQAVDDAMLDKILAKPWTADGQTFSLRIWSDRNKLVDTIQQELTRLLVTGSATPDKAIAAIASKFRTAKENAGRLVMTESSYFASIGQRDCYKELDVEQYQVVGTLDNGTCDKCSELDGQVFPMSAYQPGLTANPFHPWCRCCTAPYFADMEGVGERCARDIETGKAYAVPRDMTYKQWRASQDEKYGAGTVDKSRKMRYNYSEDEKQYNEYKSRLGSDAPETLMDFCELKYGNPTAYSELRELYTYKGRVPEATSADYKAYKAVKATGIVGSVRVPPKSIDASVLTFNDAHATRHGCTLEQAIGYVSNAKCSVTRKRWDGYHTGYYSVDGATYVADETQKIKTAFSKEDFDPTTKAVMEVFE